MTPGLRHEFWPRAALADRPYEWWRGVLGVVGYDDPPEDGAGCVPRAATTTPQLGGAEPTCEIWRTDELPASPAAHAAGDGWQLHYRAVGSWLFGVLTAIERGAGGLEAAVRDGYAPIFRLLAGGDHPHLVRVWNYLPDINHDQDGTERYRVFNTARKAAFEAGGRAIVGDVPAACALGSGSGPVSIHFLASSAAPVAIENPRQQSAYAYPLRYGKHSPIFSRASLVPGIGGKRLFVSGTASIIGHETRHAGDVAAQTHESLVNIEAVVDTANARLGERRYTLENLHFRAYVRRRTDLATVTRRFEKVLPARVPIVYLQADICREELLVEIEALG
jgi:enamine deaminase RidA (YjgF/YER057c/UK114 family)